MDNINRDRLAPTEDAGEAQSRNRDSLFLLARIRIGDATAWADVRVRNLSPGGLMAELEQSLAIGSPVELELRGVGRVSGRTAWQAEGRTGIAFDSTIDPMKARKPVGTGKGSPPPAKAIAPRR
ncbi:PilZ domain-containing protein [Sphingomonas sp.]|uniref:PilZ domain-containing protein n=1 Tax=Sphingomonas sp. TaxID=28214 RepID=UPI0035BC4701